MPTCFSISPAVFLYLLIYQVLLFYERTFAHLHIKQDRVKAILLLEGNKHQLARFSQPGNPKFVLTYNVSGKH